ncbi:MAG TPA: tyrosine-type recombinase/integrase [Vicinamibacterales bacterium]|nr:tyrosine-type recombinase/integrase [Vicinamibacterales bacterium]
MSRILWQERCAEYVALRRALGFTMRPDERLLREFVDFVERQPESAAMAHLTVTWATRTGGPGTQGRRLSIARQFLVYVQAFDTDVAVPGSGLLPSVRRSRPRLLIEQDVTRLMDAARGVGPRDALRPQTVATYIGLLASCGLRAQEAIRLTLEDVALTATPPRLTIRQTKFRKSRLVPLHATTAAALNAYAIRRHQLGYDGLCDAFFVSERGTPLNYHVIARTFVALARRLGLRGPAGTRGMSLHHLRHSFAVARLAAWAEAGDDTRDRLPALATYLGHARPQDTYWYLTAAPQVLEAAAARFEAFADFGRVTP